MVIEVLTHHSPPTSNQNFLKNTCLQQQSTTPDTHSSSTMTTIIFFMTGKLLIQSLKWMFHNFSKTHHFIDHAKAIGKILGILLCSAWKSTCKDQNMYDGEPFNVIFNQWIIFFGFLGTNVLFWLYLWQCIICLIVNVTRKVYTMLMVLNEEKQKMKQWKYEKFTLLDTL